MRALQRTVDYIEREMPEALGLDSQRDAMDYSLQAVAVDGHYMEFGVFTGGTIRYIAGHIGNKTIHGFDSFEGSPEAWSGYNLGARTFDTKGRLPRVPNNVLLHCGLFDASLPKWLADNPGPVAFVHVDCNIYSSTKTILDLLAPRLTSGSVILFDEYFHDGRETVNSVWIAPRDALEGKGERLKLLFPTERNLWKLARHADAASALAAARATPVVTVLPERTQVDGELPGLRIPLEAGYGGEAFYPRLL